MRFWSIKAFLLTAIFLVGCSSTQFRNQGSGINNPSASRISVIPINTSRVANAFGISTPPGNIWIDGQYAGDITKEMPNFSEEMMPGQHLLEVCQGDPIFGKRQQCLSLKINLAANTHIYYEYEFTGSSYKLTTTKTERYPNSQTPNSSSPVFNSSVKGNQTGLEMAKKKCIELGFKVGTESFGNCVLKVAN